MNTPNHPNQLHTIQLAMDAIKDRYPKVWAIYIFGSYGTEYQRNDSDLDLAILANSPVDQLELWELSQKIASKINRDATVVDLRQASTVFQNQIISSERRLYCSKVTESDFFETTCLSMYLKLNEERKEILDDFKKG